MGELIFVGLGLSGPEDLTVRARRALKECDAVFAEFYTSRLMDSSLEELESVLGKEIKVLAREEVEESDEIIDRAERGRVAMITPGDPMAATTHVDIRIRAEERGIDTSLFHGISIFGACASALGLQPYKFGRTVTLPFPEPGYLPDSPYENILENYERGLHTMVLLDIKEPEQRFMTCAQGVEWLMGAEEKMGKGLMSEDRLICAAARVGSPSQLLKAGYPEYIMGVDMGEPLHTLVLPGKLHFMEVRALVRFAGAPEEILG